MAIDKGFYNQKTVEEINELIKQTEERLTYMKKILQEKRS